MRIRFGHTVDVSDEQRRVIAAYNDDDTEGLDNARGRRASRAEVADYFFSALGFNGSPRLKAGDFKLRQQPKPTRKAAPNVLRRQHLRGPVLPRPESLWQRSGPGHH